MVYCRSFKLNHDSPFSMSDCEQPKQNKNEEHTSEYVDCAARIELVRSDESTLTYTRSCLYTQFVFQ